MEFAEALRDALVCLRCVVDDDREQECLVGSQKVRTIDREFPFKTEVALDPGMRILRDDRDEERTGLDLPADRGIPGVPASQVALVEPDFDPGCTE